MKNVTVGIKTFLRPEALTCCLEALRTFDWAEVIVSDDNPDFVKEVYENVYAKYRGLLPLRIIYLPFDTGVSASRNAIVATTKTDFLLMLDDDQVVNNTLTLMYDVLESNPLMGGVSCYFNEKKLARCTACDIYHEDNYIIKELRRIPEVNLTKQGTRFSLFEFIPSATLFRIACLSDISWDPFYKIGAEHLDLYLRHKQLNRWDFAVALDAYINHIHYNYKDTNASLYEAHREGPKIDKSWEYFNKKFGVRGKIEGRKLADDRAVKNTYTDK